MTAQKRSENVQDIAATVNVISGKDIEKYQAFDFSSIQQQTAGLTLASPNARNNIIAMRGVSVDPESGTATAVDTYWNDAIVRPDVAFTQMYDSGANRDPARSPGYPARPHLPGRRH